MTDAGDWDGPFKSEMDAGAALARACERYRGYLQDARPRIVARPAEGIGERTILRKWDLLFEMVD